ncbi:hypothetical protein DBR00_02520 [Pseudomonas sp. HMWF032]|uniref:hypothetical protein n=1 Tax=Pseudomonas sp. HMWF032 TaxID=2056866 RepID=UPI000D39BC61|nr:hypothetical protein [Pseudomonas sp. HMWF032]PTS86449.1 hypothetical protein DBR00_02520 [Pseudomonas sp. HMWF032]PTT81362.1 hypothetical protein DBR41_17010 [Pseudomonas sp. HMWF010]
MSNPFLLKAASRGRFLRDPNVSEKAREYLVKSASAKKGTQLVQAIMECPASGLFRGLSLTVKLSWSIHELAHLTNLLPFHLIQIRPQPEGLAAVTLSGPVQTMAAALWDIQSEFPEGDLKERLSPLLWGFNQLLAQEFPEESLCAIQALLDKYASQQ